VACAQRISSLNPQTLAHKESHRVSSIRRRLKQLNQGEAWGDQGEALELLIEAGKAQSRSCAIVEDQELQAATASPPWTIYFAKGE
jgi:hypothetical protein